MAAKATSVQSEYMFSRSCRDSARQAASYHPSRHWIWKECLGYLLHPSIPTSSPKCRVADIGTGNACWLLDLARSVPSTWRLQGFDVSSLQYPVEECLPANLSLDVLDAFDEIPPNLIGAFDIVHIRAFAAVIKGGDADPLTRNVLKLLKPGGYLQWDEFDTTTFAAHEPPNKQVDKQSADAIIDVWHRFAKKLDIALQWMPSLPSTLSNNGLTILDHPRFGSTDLTRKAATDNWMMALEEVGFVIMGRAGEAGGEITPEDYSDLLSRVVDETRSGVAIWIDMQVVAGRKDS